MRHYLSLVKFSHTIFAMPFALLGFFLSVHRGGTGFSLRLFALVVLCMVFARSAAMAFNRYLDREFDQKNPRTAVREIPAGVISPKSALFFVIGNCALFILSTWFINPLCFFLSPIALLVILGYSFTKRFTPLCHFVLGLGLALAPIGAYLAAGGGFDTIPLLYSAVVFLWVSGFDIIYALQDEDIDKALSLRSIPAFLGKKKALHLSSLVHLACAVAVFLAAWLVKDAYPSSGWINWAAATFFVLLLVYQHSIVKPDDLRRVDRAFFTANGVASLVFGGLMILDLYV